jgi:sRNA-binding carbon storage regulator CsrA
MRNGILALDVPLGSKLHIGEGFLTVLESKENKVRIALKFPQDVRIERQSVRERRLRIDRAAGEVS